MCVQVLTEAEEGVGSPGTALTDSWEDLTQVLGQNSGSLEDRALSH